MFVLDEEQKRDPHRLVALVTPSPRFFFSFYDGVTKDLIDLTPERRRTLLAPVFEKKRGTSGS